MVTGVTVAGTTWLVSLGTDWTDGPCILQLPLDEPVKPRLLNNSELGLQSQLLTHLRP